MWALKRYNNFNNPSEMRVELTGGRLGEGNNFYQKNNRPFGRLSFIPFGRVKLFLPACKVKTG